MPRSEGYVYLGCPRCGEISLVDYDEDLTCDPCLMVGSLRERRTGSELRTMAMSRFKVGDTPAGRLCEQLARAIDEAELARKRALAILARKENES